MHPQVGGWFGIVTAAVAIYMGIAELLNEVTDRVSWGGRKRIMTAKIHSQTITHAFHHP